MSKLYKIYLFLFILLFSSVYSQKKFSEYVNPFIGTGGHGHTFPGATLPFGMVQLSPDTRIDDSWDGCSGYHYSDSVIYGFSHTHLNGTGVSDYGDIMLMPTMGNPSLNNKDYSSKFSHQNEKASAGYYEVLLDKFNIKARLTTTTRVGYHEYTFNNAGQANLILDLNHRDKLLEGEVKVVDDKTIEVFRRSKAWAENQYIFARIEFSKPMKISKSDVNNPLNILFGKKIKYAFSSQVSKGEKILVKVSLSLTGFEGAEKNMLAEGKSWNFERIKRKAENFWNKELSKIEIETPETDKLSTFYSALYHVFTQPNIANDVDGKYRGRDNKIHSANHDYYTVFSLWDTFRAYHPLMTLIDKKRTADFINTFILQYEQSKRLPIWELASNETYCMIGYHSVSVIADAMINGVTGFDYEKAYEAAKNSANNFNDFGMKTYRENGFLSIDDEHESVSKTVEYAYDDWCIAQMAQFLNKANDYETFMKRSQSWKNLFDEDKKFIRPKKNGNWNEPFDPKEINNNFTEGNAWHYTFFVPQDINGMIKAYGGDEAFEKKLDQMFSEESKTTGREQVDVTGLIGQYAQGNEPSHHVAYLYNFVGKPEKTREKVHYILENFYKNAPDGLIGNEDCGQMSAWYVLSSIGLYKVTPGSTYWTTTEPLFKKIKLNLEDHNSVIFYNKNDIIEWLSKTPVAEPRKLNEIVTSPVINSEKRTFENEENIEIESALNNKTFYAINGNNFQEYTGDFKIKETSTIKAYSENNKGEKSVVVFSKIYKKPNHYSIEIQSKPHPQYFAGGNEGLIDGILGEVNWRKGDWHGYQSQDFEAIIDLKEPKEISKISLEFLQDSRAWIIAPTLVTIYTSIDNKNFLKAGEIIPRVKPDDMNAQTFNINLSFVTQKAKFVKIIAKNFGKLPDWHQGSAYNGEAYIFISEINIQ
ncbi:GH92 family glycosyl hydrolase [Cloacibacterium sp.]|uniref:GH92 family glycosyl hydrolase n=1 Tax=Cloacibacterium sp. TaxID=1913682 RepID=UPI0039E5E730